MTILEKGPSQTHIDLRAIVMSAQLKQFHSDPEVDIWQLTFWDNTKLESYKRLVQRGQ